MISLRALFKTLGVVITLASFVLLISPILSLYQMFTKDDSTRVFLNSQKYMCRLALWFLNTEMEHNIELDEFKHSNQLIIANHVSYFDIIISASLLPVSFLGKKEITEWPLIRNLGKAAKSIFVERECMHSKVSCLYQLKKELNNRNYLIFPEGTTTTSVHPTNEKWHDGFAFIAAQEKMNIWTLAIEYSDHEKRAWVDDMDLISHFWQTAKSPKLKAKLKIKKLQPANPEISLRAYSKWALSELVEDCIEAQFRLEPEAAEDLTVQSA